MDIENIKEEAFGHGFAFGKYTQQCILSDELKAVLDTDATAMREYMASFNEGFNLGFADTVRYSDFSDTKDFDDVDDIT